LLLQIQNRHGHMGISGSVCGAMISFLKGAVCWDWGGALACYKYAKILQRLLPKSQNDPKIGNAYFQKVNVCL